MNSAEFKTWREHFHLTQETAAHFFDVSRSTIHHWENGAVPVTEIAKILIDQVYTPRLKRKDPNYGPLTLIYCDEPMWMASAQRHTSLRVHQEHHSCNAVALARVQKIRANPNVQTLLIFEETGDILWTSTQLDRVVNGEDGEAPTISNLLRLISLDIKERTSDHARFTSKRHGQKEADNEQVWLKSEANVLAVIASYATSTGEVNQKYIESILARVRSFGIRPSASLIASLVQAIQAWQMP